MRVTQYLSEVGFYVFFDSRSPNALLLATGNSQRVMSALQSQVIAPQKRHANQREQLAHQPEEDELVSLWARQQALQKQLITLQRQQMHENMGRFTRPTMSLGLPDSLEMIIYGLREELERVAQQILLLRAEK